MANVPTLYGTENSFLFSFSHSQNCKVLNPGPDHTVRLEKPRIAHLCGSFGLKNPFMGKKQGPVRTVVEPHNSENRDQTTSHGSLLPFESEP